MGSAKTAKSDCELRGLCDADKCASNEFWHSDSDVFDYVQRNVNENAYDHENERDRGNSIAIASENANVRHHCVHDCASANASDYAHENGCPCAHENGIENVSGCDFCVCSVRLSANVIENASGCDLYDFAFVRMSDRALVLVSEREISIVGKMENEHVNVVWLFIIGIGKKATV